MGERQAKKLRRELREQGIDPTQRQYQRTREGALMLYECGRAAYQYLKRTGTWQ